jgi:carboxyl-terminal processing protease
MTRRRLGLLLLSAALLVAVFSVMVVVRAGRTDKQSDQEQYPLPLADARQLAQVMRLIRSEFVEQRTDSQLLEAAARGMVASLDPHSSLLDSTAYARYKSENAGRYTGLGLELVSINGIVHVHRVIEGSPAAAAGVRAGDELTVVDGRAVQPGAYEAQLDSLRGPVGEHVRLVLRRDNVIDPIQIDLWRGPVSPHSVDGMWLRPGYGYVRIALFTETTERELHRELAALEPGMSLKGLVLDLRDNPGGLLDAAVEVADDFLESGVIVTAEGRTAAAHYRRTAQPGDVSMGVPIVVLVNGGTASAAEIVAAALRDNHRARLMGTRTFGKATLQTLMPLANGRGLNITTAHYFTPSGQSIDERGLLPDVTYSMLALPWGGLPTPNDPALARAVTMLSSP